jgi:peroxiredoxin Q/BCP
LKVGSKVADFSLPATGGGSFRLKDMAGKKLVIYFYPKDMTSGCTREAQDFRDLHAAFAKAGASCPLSSSPMWTSGCAGCSM